MEKAQDAINSETAPATCRREYAEGAPSEAHGSASTGEEEHKEEEEGGNAVEEDGQAGAKAVCTSICLARETSVWQLVAL